jgi:copper chaperone CopZ
MFERTFSNRIGIIYVEIDKNKGTAVISYDDTKMSLFDINEAVTKMRFKLEGISYLS